MEPREPLYRINWDELNALPRACGDGPPSGSPPHPPIPTGARKHRRPDLDICGSDARHAPIPGSVGMDRASRGLTHERRRRDGPPAVPGMRSVPPHDAVPAHGSSTSTKH